MQYEYVLQSIKSKKFWSNNAGWTKNLNNACRWEYKGDIGPTDAQVLVKVRVITRVVRA